MVDLVDSSFQPLTIQLFILVSSQIAFYSSKIPRNKEGRNCSSLPSFTPHSHWWKKIKKGEFGSAEIFHWNEAQTLELYFSIEGLTNVLRDNM